MKALFNFDIRYEVTCGWCGVTEAIGAGARVRRGEEIPFPTLPPGWACSERDGVPVCPKHRITVTIDGVEHVIAEGEQHA